MPLLPRNPLLLLGSLWRRTNQVVEFSGKTLASHSSVPKIFVRRDAQASGGGSLLVSKRITAIPSGNRNHRSIACVLAISSTSDHSTSMPYGSRNTTARVFCQLVFLHQSRRYSFALALRTSIFF